MSRLEILRNISQTLSLNKAEISKIDWRSRASILTETQQPRKGAVVNRDGDQERLEKSHQRSGLTLPRNCEQ